MAKHLATINITPTLIYPTAPNRLRPSDIPGFQPANEEAGDDEETDSWAWWRRNDATGAYRLLNEGLSSLAATIKSSGPIDAVMGFSQGGCAASLVTAALEEPHRPVPVNSLGYDWEWVEALRTANGGHPLKFAVIYSGFFAPPEELRWLYEPMIETPSLHFIGSLDTVVDETRSQALVERFVKPTVMVHQGGHHVPVSKQWSNPLIGFLQKMCSNEVKKDEKEEEDEE